MLLDYRNSPAAIVRLGGAGVNGLPPPQPHRVQAASAVEQCADGDASGPARLYRTPDSPHIAVRVLQPGLAASEKRSQTTHT